MSIDNPTQAAAHIEQTSKQSSVAVGITDLDHIVHDYQTSHDAAATQAFCKQLTDKLQSDNVLPQLAIAWAHENMNKYASNGELTKQDLNFRVPSTSDSPMDRTFAKMVYDQFDKIRALHKDGWFSDKDGITMNDLDVAMQKFETDRKQQNQTEHDQSSARDLTKGLAANNDALFKKIAAMHKNYSKDGNFIDQQDLQQIQDADKNVRASSEGQQSILTDDEKKTVDNLLKNWYSTDMSKIREEYKPSDPTGIFDAITLKGIAKASGYGSVDDMNKTAGGGGAPEKTQAPQPAKQETKTSDQPKPPNKPGEQPAKPENDHNQPPKQEAPLKPHLLPRPKEAAHDNELSIEMPRWGEGYIKIAQRLAGKDASPKDVNALVKELQTLNDNKPVIYGHAIKVPEKFKPTPAPYVPFDSELCGDNGNYEL
ncbi:MAG TPA: hypothetical protein V6C81_11220 [Planktothrix sp.]|jgi:hypothetical protein